MVDPKSTNDIRMIATDVMLQQSQLCEARRENVGDRLDSLTDTVRINAAAIAALTSTVAAVTSTIAPMASDVKANKDDIKALMRRPVWAAALGSAVPVLLGVLLWWFSK